MWSIFLSLSAAQAATIVVDPSGAGDSITIGGAVALLNDGDILQIRAGTYVESYIRLDEIEDITIQGDGSDVTILNGDGAPTHGSKTIGLTIGSGASMAGLRFENYTYGVSFDSDAGTVEIADCVFLDNVVAVSGRSDSDETVSIHHNLFASDAEYPTLGTGLYTNSNLLHLDFEDNVLIDLAYGILGWYEYGLPGGDTYNIVNNTFVGISTSTMTWSETYDDVTLTIANNVFEDDHSPYSLGVNYVAEVTGNLTGTGCDRPGYTADPRSTVHDEVSGDPLFVSWTDDGDWTDDDLHLMSGSAAIDIGLDGYALLDTDYDGNSRSADGDLDCVAAPDAGAYEFQPDTDPCPGEDTGTADDTGDTADSGSDPDTDSGEDTATDSGGDSTSADTGETGETGAADSETSETTDSTDTVPEGDTDRESGGAGRDTGTTTPGCGCAQGGSDPSAAFLILAVLVGRRRRRARPLSIRRR